MELDGNTCYRALETRDPRFDGRFFTAVKSTGIYCRPICPAATPKRKNCTFMPSAAAAHEAGYRPCLRCRPEASPGTPAWGGTSATVSRALGLIAEGALDESSVDDLATRLGMGERHLRRLFVKHLGAAPMAVAQTQRILFAKKLINETDLPMTEVALSAGFSSIRRFNDALLKTYGRSPRELRRADAWSGKPASSAEMRLKLPYRPPFSWTGLLCFLAPRAIPRVEFVGGDFYQRTLEIENTTGLIDVRAVEGADHLLATIRLSRAVPLIRLVERLRRLFDLGADPVVVSRHLGRDSRLKKAVRRSPGLRVPGAWDGFELAVRAILGQQISVKGATTLAGRLVAKYGREIQLPEIGGEDAPQMLFPRPEALADNDLGGIGLTGARVKAIRALAAAVASGELDISASTSLEESVARLRNLDGIGDWTAQYIAMRALGEPDAFPASDLGLRKALATGETLPSPAAVEAMAESWRPWRSYAAMHLWNSLSS